ncbi:MAG TPA: acyltransferase [Pseudomonadales bacterium]|nr:acyltransferase [Pseudomonadales bacterium]
MKNKLKNIQALRGIAVLLVMLLHLSAIEKKYSTDTIIPDFLHFGAFGVDIFFMISGFIMMTVTEGLARGSTTSSRFLLLRMTRIYPLYWLTTALLALLVWLAPGILSTPPSGVSFLFNSFFLLPQESIPLLSVGWTLVHEIYFYLVFACLLFLPEKKLPVSLLVWSLATIIFYYYLSPVQEQAPWTYIAFNPLTLEFTTGCGIALLLRKWQPRSPTALLFAGFALAIVIWKYWQEQSGNSSDFPLGGDRVIYFLLPCALLLTGCTTMELRGLYLPAFLQKIGDTSYSIYLTHVLALSAMGKIWQLFTIRDSIVDNLVALPVIFVLTIFTGVLCSRLLERAILEFFRRHLHISRQ